MSLSRALSTAEQRTIISSANIAVSVYVNSLTAKFPNKYFFTKEDIEDIAGEVIFRACRSYDRFDSERSSLKTWVSRIALNCVKDALDYRMKRFGLSEPMYSENSKDDDEYNKVETSDSKKGFDMLYSPMGPFLLHNFDYVKLCPNLAVPFVPALNSRHEN